MNFAMLIKELLPEDTIENIIDDLIENFKAAQELGTEFLYQTLIDYGKNLGDYPEELMKDEYKIHNCQSTVYIYGEIVNDRLYLISYADSRLVQGQVAVLLKIYSGQPKEDIINSEEYLKKFVNETKIIENLTPSRQNAFASMFEHIKKLAGNN